ncbi:hypothetical protein QJS10_CPB20g00950 [Acorus calamus]|uniref:DM2 domain-containing protein n=1 Tax=Acorus calamus TaxID=4465 RepID=A0AAV9CCK2_ACOCL|nr:hypothetical protein QJS10_CPB20g00950 [Acorus calamus]
MSRVLAGSRALMAAASSSSSATMAVKKPPPTAVDAAAPKRTNNPLLKALPVSPAMRAFLGGSPEASRVDVLKKIWGHIKGNQLQNPANKREINCDEKLKTIMAGKDKIGMMEIAKLLKPHFVKK